MKRPSKALLLAAGLGTRMRPLTSEMPKPLMPLWGKPVVDHLIDMLGGWGVNDVLINLHHLADPLFRHLRQARGDGIRINMSFEPGILGTGGALRRAEWFFDDSPFWVVNCDIAADVSPEPFLREFESRSPLAALWLHPEAGPRTVEMSDGAVTSFHSTSPSSPGTYTFCGLHLVSPVVLDFIPPGPSSIVDAYSRAMLAGRKIRGVVVQDSMWADLGTPERYLDAHREILRRHDAGLRGSALYASRRVTSVASLKRRGARVTGFAAVGKDVAVGGRTQFCDSVVWDGASISAGSRLNGAIVSARVCASGDIDGVAVPVGAAGGKALIGRVLNCLGWRAGDTTAVRLGPRGSDRTFTRLSTPAHSAILIEYGTARPENERYAGHALFLEQCGVPVPRIIADFPEDRAIVAEDLGTDALELAVRSLPEGQVEARYRDVLDALFLMHSIPMPAKTQCAVGLGPRFDSKMYRWERDLLADHYLRKRLGLTDSVITGVMRDLESVAGVLVGAEPVLVHRDMQSSNVLWHKGRPVFIDFQGMRMGPAVYDLASLLCDPYVMHHSSIRERLLAHYAELSGDADRIHDLFWYGAVQRLAQVLGAFGRLSAIPETRRFEKHIGPAIEMMGEALGNLEGLSNLKALIETLADAKSAAVSARDTDSTPISPGSRRRSSH